MPTRVLVFCAHSDDQAFGAGGYIAKLAADKKKVKTDVRDAVSRVADLPVEVDENPIVEEITTSTAIPVIEVGLTGDVPYALLRETARRAEQELRAVPECEVHLAHDGSVIVSGVAAAALARALDEPAPVDH